MTHSRRIWTVSHYLLGLALLLPVAAATAKEPPTQPRTTEFESRLDAVVRPYLDAKVLVGAVVGIVKDGQAEVFGLGALTRGGEIKPDGDTVYEIGSVTKALTGLLLADLVLDETVRLDQSVRELLPEDISVPKHEDREITLVDLSTHTSGLPRMPSNFAPANPSNPYVDYDVAKLYAWLKSATLEREPGTSYAYSNVGAGLLGHALARANDTTYEEALRTRIFAPLGMNDTSIALSSAQRARLAPGHTADLTPVANWDLDALAGAGAVRSTANDMLRLVRAALTPGGPIHADFDLALKRHFSKPGFPHALGLGWHASPDGERWWHNGQTGGYHAFIVVRPTEKIGAVILSNTAAPQVDALGKSVEDLLRGKTVEAPKLRPVAKIDPALLDDYPGVYRLAPTFAITVTREKDQLFVQATDQPKFAVYVAGNDVFFLRVVEAEIHFERNEEMEVVRLVLHQNGQKTQGVREE